jgi:L-2-hydroxycarboxylate dehydrogenase (NAD+)
MVRIGVPEFRSLCLEAFRANGFTAAEALACADELVDAECRGRRAHGLAMLGRLLEWKSRAGEPVTTFDSPVSAHIAGNGALGPLLAATAMEMAIAKARDGSVGLVGVRNASAFLTAGYQSRRAAEEGLIGISLSVAASKVAPWGGAEPLIGTNPIGIGIPSDEGPIVVDVAVGQLTVAEVRRAARDGVPLPAGAAIDAGGEPTVDPAIALDGALLPFGGHKGSGIGMVVELLAGAFVGTLVGREKDGRGMLFVAIDPDALGGGNSLASSAARFATEVRASTPRGGFSEVLMPGDRGNRLRERAEVDGIAVDDQALERLRGLGQGSG